MRLSSLSWKILIGIVPVLLASLAFSVVLQNRFQEAEMMEQAQVSADTYADLIRESLVSMMVNSAEVDTTFLVRVNGIRHLDTLSVLVNELRIREEMLDEEQVQRLRSKRRLVPVMDSVQRRVLRAGQPEFFRDGPPFRAAIRPRVFLDDALADELDAWIRRNYRDRLLPADLADPQLLDASRRALDELTRILALPPVYEFQRAAG